jgi:hypothetical protein
LILVEGFTVLGEREKPRGTSRERDQERERPQTPEFVNLVEKGLTREMGYVTVDDRVWLEKDVSKWKGSEDPVERG